MKKIKDILKLKYITELSYKQINRGINVPSSTTVKGLKQPHTV